METKQIQTNVFTDGLNTDLHPLTTPNTVLTDCINGTIITYNGNEYILQNDMGNYQLKKAQLPADYIPVGIKEYGNIIYIVSYNPIEKKCQIGSYPSPQTLFDNVEKPSKNSSYHGIEMHNLSVDWRWNEDGTISPNNTTDVLFTKYSPNQNVVILFPEEGDIKNTFLSPGDKYWLYVSNPEEQNTWKFQKTEYYSLTESKELYKIEEKVVEQKTKVVDDTIMPYVSWETSGWLGYKPSLLNLDSFNIYLTDIALPSFLTENDGTNGILSFEVQGQVTVLSDPDWIRYFPKLLVLFEYKSSSNDPEKSKWKYLGEGRIQSQETLSGGTATNYGNKIDVLTYNVQSGDLLVDNSDKIITIRATPYIIDDGYGIVYDNFKVEYTINLADIHGIKDITAFKTYKYLVTENDITINFSIFSPTTNMQTLDGKYRIWSLKNNSGTIMQDRIVVGNRNENEGFMQIPSLTFLGQNILNISFDDKFTKENIYVFELGIFDKTTGERLQSYKQLLVASELMNDFYSTNNAFQNILCNEWISNATDYQELENKPDIVVTKEAGKEGFFGVSSKKNIREVEPCPEHDAITNMPTEFDSVYYTGYIKKQDLKFKYTLNDPTIFNNKQNTIWSNPKFKTTVKGNLKYISNNKSESISGDEVTFTPNQQKIYDKLNAPYFNSLYYIYTPIPVEGKNGKREYLYRHLFVKGSGLTPKGVTKSGIPFKLPIYTPPKDTAILVNSKINKKDGKLGIWYEDGIYEGRVTEASETFHTTKPSTDTTVSFWTENAEEIDSEIARRLGNNPSLFVPIIFRTCGSGNTNKGFFTPDNKFANDHTGYAEAIGLLCKEGSKVSLAVIAFYNDANEKGWYMYKSNNFYKSYYFTSKTAFSPYQNNNSILKTLFRICLHLYRFDGDTNIITKNFLKNQNLQETYNTGDTYNAIYTRMDQLQNIPYLGYDLATKENRNILIEDLNDTNNLKSEESPLFKSFSKKVKLDYSINGDSNDDSLGFDESKVTNYNTVIENKTNRAIDEYDATREYDNTRIYNDFVEDQTIANELNDFAKKLVVVNDTVYYNGMPSLGIGGAYGNNKHEGDSIIRYIDLSSTLSMKDLSSTDSINKLNRVTDEFN